MNKYAKFMYAAFIIGAVSFKIIFLSLVGLFVAGCGKQPVTNDFVLWKIDPTSARKTDLTQIVDSIFLVPLETNDSCLIKKVYSIIYSGNRWYMNNNCLEVQVYDDSGKFLYSTKECFGDGPKNYRYVQAFKVLDNDTLEIFDAVSCKLYYYVRSEGLISSFDIPKGILPAGEYEWLNADTCVFSEGSVQNSALKMYSKSKSKIFKTTIDKQEADFVKTSKTLYRVDDKLYYAAAYPSNELYSLDNSLSKNLVYRLDFGEYNFSVKDLPEGNSRKFYYDYIEENNKVYPFSKYALDNTWISFFQFDKLLHIAYMNRTTGKSFTFKNEIGSHHQFLMPTLVQDNCFFYVSEPGYLPYMVDTTLMNHVEIDKMNHVEEMDNPIIIIYKMKME